MKSPESHRWSGWPGAMCLDCGSDDAVELCIAECEWNRVPFGSKTIAERQQALDKLVHSAKWKKPLDDDERDFLAKQAK